MLGPLIARVLQLEPFRVGLDNIVLPKTRGSATSNIDGVGIGLKRVEGAYLI
jgi:hypothetical protein